MAKSALRRRRGTRKSSGSFLSNAGFLPALLGACVLIVIGLAGGILMGLMAFSGTKSDFSLRKPLEPILSLSRKNSVVSHTDERSTQGANAGSAAQVVDDGIINKEDFLNHEPIIGNQGAFPYHQQLVEQDHDFFSFKPQGGGRFDEYKHGNSPYSYSPGESDALARSRRYHIKKAMQHAWTGYETYAFGKDELKPKSMKGDNGWGGIGITLVDSLDTLWLMDMKDEFYRARDWVKNHLDHNIYKAVSVFETTIRSLGGLLSAYDWSGDEVFLDQALDLGSRLFKSFNTPTGIPTSQVNLATGQSKNIAWTGNSAITAEFGTLQLEFRMLARLSGILDYKEKSEHIYKLMNDMHPAHGLYPYFIRNQGNKPEFANNKLTFGAMSDSFYEYMLKIWLQGGRKEQFYRDMYDKSMQGMFDELLQVSSPSGLVYIADKNNGVLDTKMDHLVCFMGGLLALGAYTDPLGLHSERAQRDLKTAKAITYTCYQMYARMETGISPEYIQFFPGKDFQSGRGAPHYLLRPETVESFFILYHLTGDPIYREWGWEVFQAIERYCRTAAGYGSLKNVHLPDIEPEDKMESFYLAETLKYLYLLFDPETPVDLLHKHVFNTEAHPMRIFPIMDEEGVMDLLKQ
ncbi:glycosyl hydrolase family 47 protein [Nitzschia inconspicua]|uniref:Glycosyl hydrolase family 47 protein n=1 Tax=Nitzschia inconspicua TaxID=303405 RepID=A0A9K3Q6D6_9STRA|nr:glycosyl hydrolase family 47 protein [Nitzschia inconspicua]